MFFFYKIFNGLAPQYLCDYLPARNAALVNLRVRHPIYPLETRTERYRKLFLPILYITGNSLDSRIRDLPSISRFKRAIFEFFRPRPSSTFKVQNHWGVVFLTRLRVGFSYLREHKFRHGFLDTVDPFCNYRTNSIETTELFH